MTLLGWWDLLAADEVGWWGSMWVSLILLSVGDGNACTVCLIAAGSKTMKPPPRSLLDIHTAAALQRRATPQSSDVSLTHEAPFMLMVRCEVFSREAYFAG